MRFLIALIIVPYLAMPTAPSSAQAQDTEPGAATDGQASKTASAAETRTSSAGDQAARRTTAPPSKNPRSSETTAAGTAGVEATAGVEGAAGASQSAATEAKGATATDTSPGQATKAQTPKRPQGRRRAPAPKRRWEPPAPPVRGVEPRLTVGIGGILRLKAKDDYGLFGDDNQTMSPEVFVSFDILEPMPRWMLAVEAGYGLEEDGSSALLGEALSSTLTTHHIHMGGNLRFKWLPFLQPHLRLVGGISLAESELALTSTNFRARQEDTSFFLRGGLGLTLRSPPGRLGSGPFDRRGEASLSVGLRVEGGFTLARSLQVDLAQADPPEGAVNTRDANLGSVGRYGPYAMVSVIGAL